MAPAGLQRREVPAPAAALVRQQQAPDAERERKAVLPTV
jgi:hypothetical protein